MRHAIAFMSQMLEAAGGHDLWQSDDTSHVLGTCRMSADPATGVVDADGRSFDILICGFATDPCFRRVAASTRR